MSAVGPAPSIRVAVVDDHALIREGLRLLIGAEPDMVAVGEASGLADGFALVTREQPDVVVLDLALGSERGENMIGGIGDVAPHCAVLILTGLKADDGHRSLVLRGARGVVAKETAVAVLIKAIRKVHQGEIWLERSHMGTLMGEMIRGAHPGDPHAERIAALTGRERDVIALVGEGLRNDAIGARLSLREKTVRNHLTSIYEKLGVKDRLELAIYAHRHRLATFEPPPAPDAS